MLPAQDPRLDGAFTLFYMSINIGSLISLSLAPVITDHYGYTVTYNLCGVGLIIALLTFFACRNMVKDIGSGGSPAAQLQQAAAGDVVIAWTSGLWAGARGDAGGVNIGPRCQEGYTFHL